MMGWQAAGRDRGGSGIMTRLANQVAARRAALSDTARAFVTQPEPRTIGHVARGRQMIAGNFRFAGHLIEAPGRGPWDLVPPDRDFADEVQGFGWLDDLAAVGDRAAQACAQDWTFRWIARCGRGGGPGWSPDLTGRRLIRWINHALFLLSGRSSEDSRAFFAAMGAQVVFLQHRWPAAAPGLPRFEALAGLVYAGLALEGTEERTRPAVDALARECRAEIDARGGLPSRNPEHLLEVFSLLTWAAQALGETGRTVAPDHLSALARIAPTLRALRHADGGLARFHGGGAGAEGRLDAALLGSGVRPGGLPARPMGFARLAAGRTTVIVDAADPPAGRASAGAHASTLAFELTSGRRPVIVSCGPGATFGPDWRRAARATASHSTLSVEAFSSSRFGAGAEQRDLLADRARVAVLRDAGVADGPGIALSHDGWAATHGLVHTRELDLTGGGRRLSGTDTLAAATPEGRARHAGVVRRRPQGTAWALRFHLHPDVEARLDLGGTAVSLVLKSGEVWVFRPEGGHRPRLEPSVHLEPGRLKPRASLQIVVSGLLAGPEVRIGWTLAKAQDTPTAIRDTQPGQGAAS